MLPIKHYIRYNLTPKCPLDLIAKARFSKILEVRVIIHIFWMTMAENSEWKSVLKINVTNEQGDVIRALFGHYDWDVIRALFGHYDWDVIRALFGHYDRCY